MRCPRCWTRRKEVSALKRMESTVRADESTASFACLTDAPFRTFAAVTIPRRDVSTSDAAILLVWLRTPQTRPLTRKATQPPRQGQALRRRTRRRQRQTSTEPNLKRPQRSIGRVGLRVCRQKQGLRTSQQYSRSREKQCRHTCRQQDKERTRIRRSGIQLSRRQRPQFSCSANSLPCCASALRWRRPRSPHQGSTIQQFSLYPKDQFA